MPKQKKSEDRKTRRKKRSDPFCLQSHDNPGDWQHCPVCKKDFKKATAAAYLEGGALYLSKDKKNSVLTKPDRHQAFLYFYAHECYPEPKLCADGPDEGVVIDVVKDVYGGQFDLCWCSLACMRKWFIRLFDEMESQLQSKMDKLRRKALKSKGIKK
jgi:hypothetical protein